MLGSTDCNNLYRSYLNLALRIEEKDMEEASVGEDSWAASWNERVQRREERRMMRRLLEKEEVG
jgi:hypothetical protein